MRAVTIADGSIAVSDHPDPSPGAGEVLVRVKAAGLNGADLLQLAGLYPPPAGAPERIPGLEFAGEVVQTGPRAHRFQAGARVMGIVAGGGQAELVAVHERQLMEVPPSVSFTQAGGFPEVFITAHDALFSQAGLRPGERLLVHGGAGGVGTAAVQLGRLVGATVFATVREASLRERVAALGATALAPERFSEHAPYDVILELVGAPNLGPNLEALNSGGRICVIGVGAGAKGALNLLALMGKRARIHGSTLRARPLEEKALATRRVELELLPHLAKGNLQVPVERAYPLAEAAQAYDRFRAGGKFGKIVLTF